MHPIKKGGKKEPFNLGETMCVSIRSPMRAAVALRRVAHTRACDRARVLGSAASGEGKAAQQTAEEVRGNHLALV